jgi:hypothetical protein
MPSFSKNSSPQLSSISRDLPPARLVLERALELDDRDVAAELRGCVGGRGEERRSTAQAIEQASAS